MNVCMVHVMSRCGTDEPLKTLQQKYVALTTLHTLILYMWQL